jgi:hypothetical protein
MAATIFKKNDYIWILKYRIMKNYILHIGITILFWRVVREEGKTKSYFTMEQIEQKNWPPDSTQIQIDLLLQWRNGLLIHPAGFTIRIGYKIEIWFFQREHLSLTISNWRIWNHWFFAEFWNFKKVDSWILSENWQTKPVSNSYVFKVGCG